MGTILLIICHPNPRSFTHAVARSLSAAIAREGHTPIAHDLYAEGFDPVLADSELKRRLSFDGLVARHVRDLESAGGLALAHPATTRAPLAEPDPLVERPKEQRRPGRDAFIRATLMAVPGARKNSMNAHTLPGCVLGTYKSVGQPVQLINAFETPVRPKSGLLDASIEALKAHHAKLKETWGIPCDAEVILPDVNLNAFCQALTQHVV